MNDKSGPDRVLLIGAVAVGLLVLVAAVVALAGREPELLDPATPEGTAQRYVQAVIDGDITTIDELLVPEDCDLGPSYYGDQAVRVRLVDTEVTGDTAVVEIELSHSGGNPLFGGYGWEESAIINLERTDTGWGVAEHSWPYFWCEELRP